MDGREDVTDWCSDGVSGTVDILVDCLMEGLYVFSFTTALVVVGVANCDEFEVDVRTLCWAFKEARNCFNWSVYVGALTWDGIVPVVAFGGVGLD